MPGALGAHSAMVQDDLGWNDMGYDVNPDPTAPMDHDHETPFNPLSNAVPEVKPEVKIQQDRIAEQLNVQAEAMVGHVAVRAPVQQIAHSVEAAPATFEMAQPELPVEVAASPSVAPVPAEIVSIASKVKAKAPAVRAAPGQGAKSAFTLRLDAKRHLKLRLACAVRHQSAQHLVTDALDRFLEMLPEIDQLASQLPNTPKQHSC
jgi:hypothetical protein